LGGSPDIVVLDPVPLVIMLPGDLVNVQVPVAGKPFNTTSPVVMAQVGCVIVPTDGGVGDPGTELITTLAEAAEVQLSEFVTVNV
jgi:hypothetical protein